MIRVIYLLVTLLLVEGGVQYWSHRNLAPSTDPVFHLKDAELVSKAPRPFGLALEMFKADRGMERFEDLPGGVRLQTMYFEWDEVETGPMIEISGHESEVCNVAAGYTQVGPAEDRTLSIPGSPELDFRFTRLSDASGREVYAYKIPMWVQGLGGRLVDSTRDRTLRLQRSFSRHRGAARILQIAVFGAPDEATAWSIASDRLLQEIEWR